MTIGPDTEPPKLKCPQNIQQKDPIVDYEASGTDNDTLNPVKITYDKAPKTTFLVGMTTTVNVKATDAAGN